MKLKVYLALHDITIRDFSKNVECSYEHMTNIVNGRVCPSPRLTKDIMAATLGQVTAEDIKEYYEKKKLPNIVFSVDLSQHTGHHNQNQQTCDTEKQQEERLVS